ncbi:MAG: STAS domain-containing protein [Anaerolineales bacterium]|jgi:anti-anti-sigma regulatory factor|uniref:STAS domain-containing protein n=1 Tax=Candidatus Villigracilis vicinus TaxID=3140679 RepID=UPI003136D581|nr:STAS domain-containing protein [Anaerolineales bacterium]MBK7450821.1 STAS domain-containing protein [Anaerolineales bacterium]MBK9780151.1 STAS domain-containing protein [Anaerolineales bacterium]
MQISFSKYEDITVVHLVGDVDSSNYTDVIAKAQELFDDGVRNLLLDLTQVPYVSSAGLMALHTVARIYSGHSLQGKDGGRPIFRAINLKEDASAREHVKLLNPQPAVDQVLDVVGLKQFFEIFADLDTAVGSFA